MDFNNLTDEELYKLLTEQSGSETDPQRDIASSMQSQNPDLVNPETGAKFYPGLMSSANKATGITPPIAPKPIPTKVDEIREANPKPTGEVLPPQYPVGKGGSARQPFEMPQLPGFNPPDFDYPEFQDVTTKKDDTTNSDSDTTQRLLANLNMGTNRIISALGRTNPDYSVANSITDAADKALAKKSKDKTDKNALLQEYLKNKYAAMNERSRNAIERQKLGLDAFKTKLEYALKKSELSGKSKEGPGLKKLDEKMADDFIGWTSKGQTIAEKALDNLEYVAKQLKIDPELRPTLGYVFARNIPEYGEDIAKLKFPKIATARAKSLQAIVPELKNYLPQRFTQKEMEVLLSTVFDPTLPPEVSSQNLKNWVDITRSQIKQKGDMMRYYHKNGYSMEGFPINDGIIRRVE